MKMSLTRYGLPEMVIVPLIFLALAVVCWLGLPDHVRIWPAILAGALLIFSLAFFRDPQRLVPAEDNLLVAPADGVITDIVEVDEDEYLKGPALRIGIFLSVFDVHINRSPCGGVVEYVKAHPGKCVNALNADEASAYNRSTCMGLRCDSAGAGKVMVKQITGLIARRIVCAAQPGNRLEAGQKFGMIKFGSRTELFMPVDEKARIVVKKGDKVRAGSSILVNFQLSLDRHAAVTR